jgi:predicted ATPase/uncharacterized protein HemY
VSYQFQQDGRDHRQQLLDYFREKHLLLVLDNFEHVLAGAALVNDILLAAPGVKALATSRERLSLSGETVFNLVGMDFPDWRTPREALEYSAVKLFLLGARRAQPGFELQPRDLKAVARICQMVQGMPLGILLAAGWVEALPVDEIAREIEQSLDFLETELRDVPERHRSMRAVFEYSWSLLSAEQRAIFSKLAVFRGGFIREAAQAITGAGLRPLTALVNKSLLRRDPTGRYEVHELLRQYAQARLADTPDQQDATHDAHSVYYGEFLRGRESELWSKNEKQAIEVIEAEIENIRAGWSWALERDHFDVIDHSLYAMTIFSEARGWFKEAVELLEQVAQGLERKPDGRNNPLLWRVRSAQAWLGLRLGNTERLTMLASEGLDTLKRLGRFADTGFALDALGYAAMMRGQFVEARQYGEENVQMAHQMNDEPRRIRALANMGYAVYLQGNYQEAKQIYQEVVGFLENAGSLSGQAYCTNNLGEFCHTLREIDEAKRLFEGSLAIFREIGNRHGMAVTLNNLGNLAHYAGDYETARHYAERSLEIYREGGDRKGVADALHRLGNAYLAECRYPQAKQALLESAELYRQQGDQRGRGASLVLAGTVLGFMDNHEQALPLFAESLQARRENGNREEIADGLFHLALTYVGMRDYERASDYIEQCRSVYTQADLRNAPVIGFDMIIRAIIAYETGDYETALRYNREGLAFEEQANDRWNATLARIMVGHTEQAMGRYAEARQLFVQALQSAQTMRAPIWISHALTGLAHIIGIEGEAERAVALLTLTHNHYSMWFFARRRSSEYLAEWQTKLPPEVFATAVERGKRMDLQAETKAVLEACQSVSEN